MNELFKKIETNTDSFRKTLDDYYSLYVDDIMNKEDYIEVYQYYIDKLIDLSTLIYTLVELDIIDFNECNKLNDYVDKVFKNCVELYTVA